MRRISFKALALAVVGAVSLTACGGGSGGGGSTETTDPAAATGKLRVLVPSYPASNDGKAAIDKVIATFNAKYPKVTVEPDYATFDTLNQKISTSIAGGQGYDVLVTGVGWIPPFASKNVFEDLSTFGVTDESLGASTNPAMLPATKYEDKIYAVPLIASPKVLALSKSAFEKAGLDPSTPPTTMAEIKTAAEKLTVKDSSGKITQAGFDFWAAPGGYRQDFVTFLGSKGVPLYDESAQPKFNGPEGVETLDWMKSMVGTVQDYGAQNAAKAPLVLTGEAAMGFVGSYVDCSDKGVGKKVCGDLVFFNAEDVQASMFTGGQLASVGKNSKLKPAAYEFIQAMSTPEALGDIGKLNFAVPATTEGQDSEVVKSNPASTFAAANLDDAMFEGGPSNWLDVRGQFGTAIDDALLGKKTSQEVLDQLAQVK
jgi:multiple sugar transport system substrate-binding protein